MLGHEYYKSFTASFIWFCALIIFASGHSYAEQGNEQPVVCLNSEKRQGLYSNMSAPVDINRGNIKDFQSGQETKQAISCPRVFVDMNPIEGTNTYRGKLHIIYDEGSNPHTYNYDSGDSIEDNQYNSWYGSWDTDTSGNMNAKFSAIFQQDVGRMAVILQINKVVLQTDRYLKGSGDIWFKTFRAYTPRSRSDDVCYHEGQYLKHLISPPPIPPWKCWLLAMGPYSCLPDGIDRKQFDSQNPTPKNKKSIDIRSTPHCYSKFGTFRNLNIKRAFNLSDGEVYP